MIFKIFKNIEQVKEHLRFSNKLLFTKHSRITILNSSQKLFFGLFFKTLSKHSQKF